MHKEKRYLALIPARGGSKGIPGKNIRPLQGVPMIAYTIEAARKCLYIDEVIVSTDSEEIADVARKYGATVPFLRPENLADDQSKTIDCVLDTLEKLEETYDVLVLLQPTSPLRTSDDITEAIETYARQKVDLVSISKAQNSPVLMRQIKDGEMVSLLQQNSTIRRQDMAAYYRVNGAIYINEIDKLSADTSFNDNTGYYIMKPEHSIDIDTPADLALCEFYLS